MYNLRYHIASLVAVFLALSVGLLLGTVVVERGVLNAQKTTLVSSLQKDYDRLRADIKVQTGKAETLSSFSGEAAPVVVSSVLSGKTILVLTDPTSGETAKYATDAVLAAGGTPVLVTFTGPGLSLDDAEVKSAAAKALALPEASVDPTAVVTELAREWTTAGSARTLTAALVQAGALRLDGLQPTVAADGTIATAVADERPDAVALSLARMLTGPGRSSVGVETTKRATGLSKAAREQSLSGVEDIDTGLGTVSLVWTVAGRVSGLFGPSKDADAAYPTPLFPAR